MKALGSPLQLQPIFCSVSRKIRIARKWTHMAFITSRNDYCNSNSPLIETDIVLAN